MVGRWKHIPCDVFHYMQYPEMYLRVTPTGYGKAKGTHLSVQLYLVRGGCKREYIMEENYYSYLKRGEKEKTLWQMASLAHLHVMILNQITDSEHYSLKTILNLNISSLINFAIAKC